MPKPTPTSQILLHSRRCAYTHLTAHFGRVEANRMLDAASDVYVLANHARFLRARFYNVSAVHAASRDPGVVVGEASSSTKKQRTVNLVSLSKARARWSKLTAEGATRSFRIANFCGTYVDVDEMQAWFGRYKTAEVVSRLSRPESSMSQVAVWSHTARKYISAARERSSSSGSGSSENGDIVSLHGAVVEEQLFRRSVWNALAELRNNTLHEFRGFLAEASLRCVVVVAPSADADTTTTTTTDAHVCVHNTSTGTVWWRDLNDEHVRCRYQRQTSVVVAVHALVSTLPSDLVLRILECAQLRRRRVVTQRPPRIWPDRWPRAEQCDGVLAIEVDMLGNELR